MLSTWESQRPTRRVKKAVRGLYRESEVWECLLLMTGCNFEWDCVCESPLKTTEGTTNSYVIPKHATSIHRFCIHSHQKTTGTALLFSVGYFTSFLWFSPNCLQLLKHIFIGKYIKYGKGKSWTHLNPEMTLAMYKKEYYRKIYHWLHCIVSIVSLEKTLPNKITSW